MVGGWARRARQVWYCWRQQLLSVRALWSSCAADRYNAMVAHHQLDGWMQRVPPRERWWSTGRKFLEMSRPFDWHCWWWPFLRRRLMWGGGTWQSFWKRSRQKWRERAYVRFHVCGQCGGIHANLPGGISVWVATSWSDHHHIKRGDYKSCAEGTYLSAIEIRGQHL